MAERHWASLLGPLSIWFHRIGMNIVVNTAANVESFARWVEHDSAVSVWHLDNLFLKRLVLRDVVNENELSRVSGNRVSGRVAQHVVSAGENQERFSVGADDAGHGLARKILRVISEARVQGHE